MRSEVWDLWNHRFLRFEIEGLSPSDDTILTQKGETSHWTFETEPSVDPVSISSPVTERTITSYWDRTKQQQQQKSLSHLDQRQRESRLQLFKNYWLHYNNDIEVSTKEKVKLSANHSIKRSFGKTNFKMRTIIFQ